MSNNIFRIEAKKVINGIHQKAVIVESSQQILDDAKKAICSDLIAASLAPGIYFVELYRVANNYLEFISDVEIKINE